MGFLSSSSTFTRYFINGSIEGPLAETVREGLEANIIAEIDNQEEDRAFGWTSFESPYAPDFNASSVVVGSYFVFALRIDKKVLPAKIVQRLLAVEIKKRLSASGREFLSRDEKKDAKEHVLNVLSLRIPATPNVFDVLWNMDSGEVWLFSTQSAAQEVFETLFYKSFGAAVAPLFPYTLAETTFKLTDNELELLADIAPVPFME